MFLFDEDEGGEAWLVDKPQGWPASGELWRHASLDAEGRHSAHLPPPPALERDRSLDVAAWAPVLDCMSPRLGASLSRQASTAFSPPNSGTLPAPEWGAWLWQPGHPQARHRLQPALPASLTAAAVGAGASTDSAADTTCGGAPLMMMTPLDAPDGADEEVQQAAQQAVHRPVAAAAAQAPPQAPLQAALHATLLQPQQPHVAMPPPVMQQPLHQQPQPHGNPQLHYAHLQLQQAHAVLQLQEAQTQLQCLQRAQAQAQLQRAQQLQQLHQLQQQAAAQQREQQLAQQLMPPPPPVPMPVPHSVGIAPRPDLLPQQQAPMMPGAAAMLPPLRMQQQTVTSPPPLQQPLHPQLQHAALHHSAGLSPPAATPAAAPPLAAAAPPAKPRAPPVARNGFAPGSLAWGKISQYPWWPAVVLSPDDPSIPPDCKPSANQRVVVKFLGPGSETVWMDTRNLIPWGAPAAADKPTRSKAAAFLTALSEAREYAAALEATGGDGRGGSPDPAGAMAAAAEHPQPPGSKGQRKPKAPKGPRSPIKAPPGAGGGAGAGAKRVRVKAAARPRSTPASPPTVSADLMPTD